ncbi:type IV pilus biogenesis/stability protein PilW [Symbiopectobacterium sp. RP]|uniref:type IV pilus biogenesis/stability protein PilW n=1 Tax=Symbiopectobacterium sp. RP TaxID=3248553 RepID=UPI003D27D913
MTPRIQQDYLQRQEYVQRRVLFALGIVVPLLSGCAKVQRPSATEALVTTRLQLGMAYLKRDDLDAALRNLSSAVEAAPDDYRVQLGMALYEQRIGEYGAAERRYQTALRQAPENASVMNNYGAFLCSLGQYVAAQKQFSAAAQHPDYRDVAQALENAGYCHFKAGKCDEAHTLLVRALHYDPIKGDRVLSEVGHRLNAQHLNEARHLLDIYHHSLPASAESLWLEIRFAALAGRDDERNYHGDRLARSFPHSKQYQQFLANEY